MALLHGFELRSARARWWRHGGGDGSGADAVQHADGSEELEQKIAVHLGGLRLLLGELKEVRWPWDWLVSEGTCQEHPRKG